MKITNLKIDIGKETIVDNLNLCIDNFKILGFYGPSGSGKTTILNCIGDLLEYEGSILGIDKPISFMFQENLLFEWFTARENILFVGKEDDIEKLEIVSGILEIDNILDKRISQLSGGEKDRVSLARALYFNARSILLDEPFKSLDSKLKSRIIPKIKKFTENMGAKVIIISHNYEEINLFCDKVVIFDNFPINKAVIKEVSIEKIKYLSNKRGE
ncbi:MAG: ABC transporter [Candidatus Cloacimonadota bacterium]|nr:MAG: ABC transporter [Candidatus Cloacimonadota bacterium]PIE78021.1 MAG: ABC transporter [Candidatus Delongbacteria bacterium]